MINQNDLIPIIIEHVRGYYYFEKIYVLKHTNRSSQLTTACSHLERSYDLKLSDTKDKHGNVFTTDVRIHLHTGEVFEYHADSLCADSL